MLVSAKHQHESARGIHMSLPLELPSHLGCYGAQFECPTLQRAVTPCSLPVGIQHLAQGLTLAQRYYPILQRQGRKFWGFFKAALATTPPTPSQVWLCNPTDCSLPASSVHGILQARILGCHFLLQWLCWYTRNCPKFCIYNAYLSFSLDKRKFWNQNKMQEYSLTI